ncbi:uncharacterized protein K02A2.6-like [Octopus sinensis]|uniref:Uncharacterized protein K02A2.6-like n=1 Tax=Octopus sinensis TaxID=2607531 RepID=A0A6P7TMY7_9MOLL|nr:uncharacterized protein K02A2.6-like [Octopus sinensis]
MRKDDRKKENEAYTTIRIQKKSGRKRTNIDLRIKIDTGAQSNILPVNLYKKMFPEHITKEDKVTQGILTPSDVILTAYGGTRIPQLGKTTITGTHKGKIIKCSFYVTRTEGPAILGLNTCKKLNIVSINAEVKAAPSRIDSDMPIKDRPQITNKEELYPECFDDTVGCFVKCRYHITVDHNIKPIVHPPRRVPLEIKEKLKTELDKMEKKEIITKVTRPTDWVNSIVIKEKPNGTLRICLDPRNFNKALKREYHPIPTLEEITPSLAGSKLFSKLDASNGYWNIKIDKESSMLTTFNTPFGRYRFNRLPFGLKVSQDVFQRQIDETYQGCKGAIGIADDIQVHGKDETTHDFNLHEAMEKTRQAGIKLNAEKCIIEEKECKFFGIIYSAEGVKPGPAKVEAIRDIKDPKDRKELRSFMGLINYMGAFIPKLADHTANLRELNKDDVEFDWCASHTQDFNAIKKLISKETTLQYYDRRKPVTLQVDASMRGVGAALIHMPLKLSHPQRQVKDLTAKTITTVARGLLAEQGIPEQIICDNGTQFTSQEFKKLADEYGFNITTSSPHYPKGHGFIERQVQTVKRTLVKCRETKEDPHLALLYLRATPLRADMKSPAELLNGRKYKTTLPTKIQPPIDQEETRAKLAATQEQP